MGVVITISTALLLVTCDASCIFSSTECSCRSRKATEDVCLKPSKNGTCIKTKCPASWVCDCQMPTHVCSRKACMTWGPSHLKTQSATSSSPTSALACVPYIGVHCVMAGREVKEETCVSSATCAMNYNCVLGVCRSQGVCDGFMEEYCRVVGTNLTCCDSKSGCSRRRLQRDVPMCTTTCDEDCTEGDERIDCVFTEQVVGLISGDGFTTAKTCAGITR